MNAYALTPSAKSDLEEIWAYIAADNPEAADGLESDIYEACQLLADNPGIGESRPSWTEKPVRFWPETPELSDCLFPGAAAIGNSTDFSCGSKYPEAPE